MNHATIGWVMDQDTSKRRLHLYRAAAGEVGLTVEITGQAPATLTLDAEGVAALHNLVQQAILLLNGVGQEGA
jgi:hypothetical protein